MTIKRRKRKKTATRTEQRILDLKSAPLPAFLIGKVEPIALFLPKPGDSQATAIDLFR